MKIEGQQAFFLFAACSPPIMKGGSIMKRRNIILLGATCLIVGILAGGNISGMIQASQNREIWLRVLPIVENLKSV